jgi:DUF971 family protein
MMAEMILTEARPVRIVNREIAGELAIQWNDGGIDRHRHAALRDACRCAECLSRARRGKAAASPHDIRLTSIEPFGPNALLLGFSDGHKRGIYPFILLRELHPDHLTKDAQPACGPQNETL